MGYRERRQHRDDYAQGGSDGTVGIAPLIFHLDGIEVDTEPSIVPITITEFRAQAPKAIDSQSYHLLKQPADLPVTRFWAEPASSMTWISPSR